MKGLLILAVFLVAIGIVSSVNIANAGKKSMLAPLVGLNKLMEEKHISTLTITKQDPAELYKDESVNATATPGTYCPTCVNFMQEAINELLQIIIDVGVGGTCGDICGYLPNAIEAKICDFVCEFAGVEAFIQLITDTDPDPIWICMEIDQLCPYNDNAGANITSLTVTPAIGKQGDTFSVDIIYKVNSTIGSGEVEFIVIPPDANSLPFGTAGLIVWQTPRVYGGRWAFEAQPYENEYFVPGVYGVQAAVCQGTCGSIHSHSFTLSVRNAKFSIRA